jgi:hypothetical protein
MSIPKYLGKLTRLFRPVAPNLEEVVVNVSQKNLDWNEMLIKQRWGERPSKPKQPMPDYPLCHVSERTAEWNRQLLDYAKSQRQI